MANVLLLCITFGAGMPLLYPSAAAVFLIRYWWDKLILLRDAASPILFQARIMSLLGPWLLVAVTLNMLLSCWMFSQPDYFEFDVIKALQRSIGVPSGSQDNTATFAGRSLGEMGDRLSVGHVVPVLLVSVILLIIIASAALVKLIKISVFFGTCGARCAPTAGLADVRVVQKRGIVESALGPQCLLYGRRKGRPARARINSVVSVKLENFNPKVMDEEVALVRERVASLEPARRQSLKLIPPSPEDFPGISIFRFSTGNIIGF